ncbi:hypothetical protein ACR79S_19235 [Sphingobacterium spiritivorum]|uniref:hypothetical protein n=1 Tax=Sphingobacterium spiritivorum TaxID=258 RepID=UPI003DA51BD3
MRRSPLMLAIMLLLLAGCSSKTKKETQQVSEQADSGKTASDQPDQKVEIQEIATRFVRAYLSQDSAKVNALIHPELGLTIILRIGAGDRFQQISTLDFANPLPGFYPYPTFQNDYGITFASLPTYSCEHEKWSKDGWFIDTTTHPNTLSSLAAFLDRVEEQEIPAEEIQKMKTLEQTSYRVILTGKESVIFHITNYQNAWYVTLLDRAYSSCDA